MSLASDLELPELLPDLAPAEPPELQVVFAGDMEGPDTPGVHMIRGGALLCVEEVARFAVTEGSTIRYSPVPGTPERNIRLFLLGSAMGLLLHQRNLLPLHANAVEIDGCAVAFMGESGSGKSTLAAWFHDQGHRIIADDVCVIQFDPTGTAVALPGLPRLRLWRDVLHSTGRSPADYPVSFLGENSPDKFDVGVALDRTASEPLRLAAVYLLGQGDGKIVRLTGTEAIEVVFANTYRGGYLPIAGSAQAHWAAALSLIRSTPVFRAERQWSWDRHEETAAALRDHASVLLAEASDSTH
jgi:hypothetical protein